MFARASLVSRTNAFAPNSTFHVEYPFGSFDFSTDSNGAMVASSPESPFQPKTGGDAEMRAEDALGAFGAYLPFVTPNTGISAFLKSTTAPAGYYGLGGDDLTAIPTPVTGGTNGDVVTITETDGTPTTTIAGGDLWIVAGKIATQEPLLVAAEAAVATLEAAIVATPDLTVAENLTTVEALVVPAQTAVTAAVGIAGIDPIATRLTTAL